ncbi:hypothetical protein WISP_96355 [Willisornis vidua]|uniref:Uncharacterized protein n=1 Tax=Willisornis vidua TaxID=1566151 RepID=A0ABQ9D5V1_9PASS|nr:hypothetical protein WISP_96355 [Willisornis vidua]
MTVKVKESELMVKLWQVGAVLSAQIHTCQSAGSSGTTALKMEEIKEMPTLLGLSEDPSVMGLLMVEEQVSIPTITGVNRYHNSAPAAISQQQRLPRSHP